MSSTTLTSPTSSHSPTCSDSAAAHWAKHVKEVKYALGVCDELATEARTPDWEHMTRSRNAVLSSSFELFLCPDTCRYSIEKKLPKKIWKQAYLPFCRYDGPESLQRIREFVQSMYSWVVQLSRDVPACERTWLIYLSYLSIQMTEVGEDKHLWKEEARKWLAAAHREFPGYGGVYYCLGITQSKNCLYRQYLFAKSLGVQKPFEPARKLLCDLYLEYRDNPKSHSDLHSSLSKTIAAILFPPFMPKEVPEFLKFLPENIDKAHHPFYDICHLAFINCAFSLEVFEHEKMTSFQSLSIGTLKIFLQDWANPFVLPYVHIVLVFMCYGMKYPLTDVYKEIARFLNNLAEAFSGSTGSEYTFESHLLAEDVILRGTARIEDYFPKDNDWYINEIERITESKDIDKGMLSVSRVRQDRILYVGRKLVESGQPLGYDDGNHQFFALVPI